MRLRFKLKVHHKNSAAKEASHDTRGRCTEPPNPRPHTSLTYLNNPVAADAAGWGVGMGGRFPYAEWTEICGSDSTSLLLRLRVQGR